MRLGFPIAVVFSAGFAVFELFGRWTLLSCRIFPCRPRIFGFMPYHFLILIPLFIAVALVCVKAQGKPIATWSSLMLAASFFAFMILLEDILFFIVGGLPIRPGIFTTQWGYVKTPIAVIPIWYFFAGGSSALFLGLARIGEQRRTFNNVVAPKESLER